MTTHEPGPAPDRVRGALAGLAAGLVASLAMNGFQTALAALSSGSQQDEPATQKAADRVAVAATGAPLSDERKPAGGEAVHYVTGALIGIGYGIAAERAPLATAGFGTGLGLATAVLLDEAAVPAAGLADPPWRAPAAIHAYALASHLVFGVAAEATRRVVRRALA